MSICSQYLIAYSSYIAMIKDLGRYEKAQQNKRGCFGKFLDLLALTFLGPLIFIICIPLEFLSGIFQLFAYIGKGKESADSVNNYFMDKIEKLTSITRYQLVDLIKQMSISQLWFETIPMLILQLLVFAELVDVPELMEDGFQAVILSLCTAIANLVYTLFDMKNKS